MPQLVSNNRTPKNEDRARRNNGNGNGKLHLVDVRFPSSAQSHRQEIDRKMKALRDAIRVRKDDRPSASFPDRLTGKIINMLSSPAALWVQTGIFAAYVAYNLIVPARFDPYPFMFLSFLMNIASGYTTVVLCNSQRRQDAESEELGNAEAHVFEKMLTLLDEINRKLGEK